MGSLARSERDGGYLLFQVALHSAQQEPCMRSRDYDLKEKLLLHSIHQY